MATLFELLPASAAPLPSNRTQSTGTLSMSRWHSLAASGATYAAHDSLLGRVWPDNSTAA